MAQLASKTKTASDIFTSKAWSRSPAVLGGEWADPHVQQRVGTCIKSLRGRLREIERAATEGKRREAINRLLKSPAAKACAVICAAKDHKISWAKIDDLSRSLSPWRDCGEPVHLKLVGKANGGSRPVAAYRLKRRSLLQLCCFALNAAWGPSELDYNLRGRGVHAAIAALKSTVGNHFDHLVLVTDVKDCFSSFGQGETAELLPLPKSVVELTMLIHEDVPILSSTGTHVSSSDRDRLRQGIPQGSPASQIVASRFISDGIGSVAHDGVCLQFSDNILIAGHHKGAVLAQYNSLIERFAAHHAGGLTLHHTKMRDLVEQGIDWLGHRVWLHDPDDAWLPLAKPSKSNVMRFDDRLMEAVMEAEPEKRADLVIDRVRGWIASFKEWQLSADMIDAEVNKRLGWLPIIAAHEAAILAKYPALGAA